MPRRLHRPAPGRTHATPRPRRGHRKTISRISRSAQSPDNRTAHRWVTPLGKYARDLGFPIHPVLPASAHLESCIILRSPPVQTNARNGFLLEMSGLIPSTTSRTCLSCTRGQWVTARDIATGEISLGVSPADIPVRFNHSFLMFFELVS